MSDDPRIRVEYAVVENRNHGNGWLPAVYTNGKSLLSDWATRGYSEAEALELARAEAGREAERYVGDWDVSVERRVSDA